MDPSSKRPDFATVRFEQATFVGDAGFNGATFSDDASFDGATFTGNAVFDGATFTGNAGFGGTVFSGDAGFVSATFSGYAGFGGAAFTGDAAFDGATFSGYAGFGGAAFTGDAAFDGATFTSEARFDSVTFDGYAGFGKTTFTGDAAFDGAAFSGDATFTNAKFAALSILGPLVCARSLTLSGAIFSVPTTLEIAAAELRCARTQWLSTAALRVRYATVDLADAVLSAPAAVTAYPALFNTGSGSSIDEALLKDLDEGVEVSSIRGVDAAQLVLTDIDLSGCLFTGAFHLDQLRLAGRCTFGLTPLGLSWWGRILPYRSSPRQALAEEHHWRALHAGNSAQAQGWRTGHRHSDRVFTPRPEVIAAIYRQLRKAFEDGKDQPGAADFYYGEMEMRRHSRDTVPASERALLTAYWVISGYGLRAFRAIITLALVIAAATVIFVTVGFARSTTIAYQSTPGSPKTTSAPTYRQANIAGPKPGFGAAFYHAIDSSTALLHTPDTEALTATGKATEISLRLLGPILLGLAALAIRGRLKR